MGKRWENTAGPGGNVARVPMNNRIALVEHSSRRGDVPVIVAKLTAGGVPADGSGDSAVLGGGQGRGGHRRGAA